MRRTLEAVFRHPIQLLTLLIVLPIAGVAVIYVMVPRTYQSTASLWALHRYAVIGPAGPEPDLTSMPAQTQATAVNELLQTHVFVEAVVKGVDLAPTLNLGASVANDPQQLADALFTEISKHVVATPLTYNLFEISYTSTNPQIARQIVLSVISQYGVQGLGLSVAEGQNLLASYQIQLANAQRDLNNATAAETRYAAAHPTSKVTDDAQLASLDTARLEVQANVHDIQVAINTIQGSIVGQGTNVNTLFQVLDAPQVPDRPVSRIKSYLLGGGAGLAVALLASVLFLAILVRRDHTIFSAVELRHIAAPPVVMQLPNLSPATISLLSRSTTQRRTVLTGSKSSANGS